MKSNTTNCDLKSHWEDAYQKNEIENLGWFEENPNESLQLIKSCNLSKDAKQLHVGAGATLLIDELINQGYENIIANDLSSNALEEIQKRLETQDKKITYLVDDLTKPTKLNKLNDIELWHDRAVLHFFINKEDQKAYFDLVNKVVKDKGYVIIAVFNKTGATKCCGLNVMQYDKVMLQENLGDNFRLIESFDYTYTTPNGNNRDYIYTLFQKQKAQV